MLVGCLLACSVPGSVRADYQAGLDAYVAGAYDRAFYEWMRVVDSPEGSVPLEMLSETYYALGMLFWVGQGVSQDTSESALWLRKAADLNHAGAQSKLGYLYQSGDGVPQNDFEALKWFTMAALQGDADAQYNLGVLYRDGLGVEADAGRALQWFREAAANGDPVSAGIVAQMEDVGARSASDESRPRALLQEEPVGGRSAADESAQAEGSRASPLLQEAWLRGRDPERYTIQVIALLDARKLHEFVEAHPDWEPFAIYEQEWKGKPLWVLVQGDYADVTEARAAAKKFPTHIQKRDKLWIRKFVMIQGLLK